MTSVVDLANRALQQVGLQKRISSLDQDSAEAQSINIVLNELRDDLLRMAPWSCALKTANLTYITSAPGTPENTSAATTLWQPGQPPPPWGYEYQYPADCLRACWIIPATQTGFAGNIPITTAVTGGTAGLWAGPPVRFTVQTDTFVPVTAAAVAAGGTGHAVGDILTLATTVQGDPPIGAPAQLLVTGVSGGIITGVSVVNSVGGVSDSASGNDTVIGGSYFARQINPVAMSATTGVGSGATFNLTFGPAAPQRVILTNAEFATLVYVQQVTDPNVMDTLFQRAWVNVIAAHIALALIGDKGLANNKIEIANAAIAAARVADGNEGLTINDITPDWIQARGVDFASPYTSPWSTFDWGGLWPSYG
jgi:hypothetical protein